MMTRAPAGWLAILQACGVDSNTAGRWSGIFSEVLIDGCFSSGERELPDFLGNILVESQRLTRLVEDLTYTTPQRLMAVWPSRFKSIEQATPYLRNPKKLADFVYGSRLGNINGDGFTYRGSGLVMVTGLDNFKSVERITGYPVVAQPELLRQPLPALKLSLAWWEGKVPDEVMGNRRKVRKAVNGGDIGLAEVIAMTAKVERALAQYP